MKIYVETYGCSLNQSDSEIIMGILKENGFEITKDEMSADVIIINTCVVKKPTENKIIKRLEQLQKSGKENVLIAGCMPKVIQLEKKFPKFSIIGPNQIFKIAEIVNDVITGKRVIEIEDIKKSKLNLPKLRTNPVIEIVGISNGCIGACSYCCVKIARGELFSYPMEEIVNEIEKSLEQGVKEIWITSQDNACYGFDVGCDLANLLKSICAIKGEFFVRVGMMNPINVKKILHHLISVYKDEKIFKFLHLPVQSGSNRILKKMNRFYEVEDFKEIVNTFRDNFPNITISTDIICGFPGETDKDFEDSITLIKEIKPDILNISRFFPRPKTIAEKMEKLPGWKIKERSRKLTEIFNSIAIEKNKGWVGWSGRVIVDEIGRNKTFVARNFAYKPIVIKSDENIFGKFINVKVIDSTKNFLIGEKI
ncbi:MAG: tRNA (N(6)-L-threonylcarbamoyladenosine(37)-C(2))-methylthiotransferase [Candidatus Parvarchaeota archaeon]|nr:tRNA (N(6)-L-threonylcarbamoyladenosine(37)-C(2))-methylthiotransferase [Candidatus Jingweiarchaeum tengchongense]MCW1298314.1 tRNA (N(6)-L-threonylcarbamoyladenosine(37)-C(2))-methylthiotransferase [Candidatus Jingweiarchaeum tengchongense]MCW1300405.1 tRNA (N(6)-L-threonylcarbamoyladenosine(37)-C(2))-methylthiotransferase [Candidatus Jingweiarchaeum tengchongense]MCW1304750.1 tRNA (N(6)-L-threonylcarbamoyladenosine(37)-C(2))-methylthiotransferase [Candidatus Jingweiarchaeum tengchongense]M